MQYFSFAISDSRGNAVSKPNAICLHEIDDGIGWKHTNTRTGAVSITRSRVLVLQTIITVGNYEYIFMWHFDQAAGLHYKIQATGILSTCPIDPGVSVPFGTNVNTGVMAPFHQHVFSLRIDPCLDGDKNSVVEEDSVAMPWDEENPYGVGYTTTNRLIEHSTALESAPNRVHKIINPNIINPVSGKPVACTSTIPFRLSLSPNQEKVLTKYRCNPLPSKANASRFPKILPRSPRQIRPTPLLGNLPLRHRALRRRELHLPILTLLTHPLLLIRQHRSRVLG